MTRDSDSDSLRAVFMGTPDFALPALAALADAGCDIAAIYTQPDRRAGRGRRATPSPVKQVALERGLPVYQPASLRRDPDARRQLAELKPHLIVVAAYGLFLPPETLALPPLGALNIHPSLLPLHRGPSPVASAILAGDAATGVSIILLDEGMDSGPVLAQRETPIGADETAGALTARLFDMGATLLADTLPTWRARHITPAPQDESRATITHLLSREDGAIDWHTPAPQIARQVRAYHPWPGAFTHWNGRLLKIIEARAVDAPAGAVPGVALALPQGVAIGAGDGALLPLTLQIEGRRAVSAAEFTRGYPDFIGAILGAG